MSQLEQGIQMISNLIKNTQEDKIKNLEKSLDQQLYSQEGVDLDEITKNNKLYDIKIETLQMVEELLSNLSKQENYR